LDTLRAVVLNRFYVMADFGRDVVIPVLREELRKADASGRRFLKQARIALVREDARLDPQERYRLQNVLNTSQALRTVYEFRKRLQDIWNRTTAGHEKLLAALQEWCAQAEASGIKYLQEFAHSLRSYSLRST
jgi:stearoyl-CoA desaturase (delta-9 desaturase)